MYSHMDLKPARILGSSTAQRRLSDMSDISDCCSAPATPKGLAEWCSVKPCEGDVAYVQALQKCGLHMATRVPARIQEACITELGVEPTRDLLVGDFDTQTKERTLKPSCSYTNLLQHVFDINSSGTQKRNPKDRFLRIKNYWCIQALLVMEEFHARYPSKPEISIIMESFNSAHKALTWSQNIKHHL